MWLQSKDSEPTASADWSRRRSLTRALLGLIVAALCLAAIVAIGLLLFGSFGETEGKILLTTLAIAGYSLLGLAVTTALGRSPFWLSPLGLAVTAVGFGLAVALTWVAPDSELLGRLMGSMLVLAVALAHAALLLLLTREVADRAVLNVRQATQVATAILSAMIIFPLLTDFDPGGPYFRILGAVAVLAVLGSLVVPVLRRLRGRTLENLATPSHRLVVTYGGRSFEIEHGTLTEPERVKIETWEIAKGERVSLGSLGATGAVEERPIAFGAAVRAIVALVESERGPGGA